MHQHRRRAFGFQAVEHALHAQHLACQNRLAELEHVVARHVEHGRLDLLQRQLPRRMQQRQLLDFLVRREQVAFHPVGKKLQRALARLALRHPLMLQGQALCNPLRQRRALDRIYLHRHADSRQRAKPRP